MPSFVPKKNNLKKLFPIFLDKYHVFRWKLEQGKFINTKFKCNKDTDKIVIKLA